MAADPVTPIDVALTDPTAIVHAVADLIAGRRVEITWANDNTVAGGALDDTASVECETVEIIGCVATPGHPVTLACVLPADNPGTPRWYLRTFFSDTEDFVSIPWSQVLDISLPVAECASPELRERIIDVSRRYGHTLEMTTTVGALRIVGTVDGFEYGEQVELVITPESPRLPDLGGCGYNISLDALDHIIDWGTP